jgi:hypothetical protein
MPRPTKKPLTLRFWKCAALKSHPRLYMRSIAEPPTQDSGLQDPRLLRLLDALYTTASVTRAAQRRHHPPSAARAPRILGPARLPFTALPLSSTGIRATTRTPQTSGCVGWCRSCFYRTGRDFLRRHLPLKERLIFLLYKANKVNKCILTLQFAILRSWLGEIAHVPRGYFKLR